MNSPLRGGFSPQRGASAAETTEAEEATAHDEEPASSGRSRGRRSSGFLANLLRGYRLLRELLTQKPSTARRSQMPYRSPRFADAAASWRLALDWLTRVTRQLRLDELPAPVFDRHGCFERLEPRRLAQGTSEGLAQNDEAAAATGGGKKARRQLERLRDRILEIAGSGYLLRALSDKLLGAAGADDDGNWGDSGWRGRDTGRRRDLLQLPLTYETMAAYQHPTAHLPHFASHHHHHSHPHLPPQAQAGLAGCEENFSAFHRFLARVLTWTPPPTVAVAGGASGGGVNDNEDGSGACELRVALGKQCAECNAVCLLLRNNHNRHQAGHSQLPFHNPHRQQTQVPGAGGSDSALSVLLLHLLTLMLLLDEPMSPKQRAEVLQLWENRLQLGALADLPRNREMRRRYRELMSS